jgi:hypothetical protein
VQKVPVDFQEKHTLVIPLHKATTFVSTQVEPAVESMVVLIHIQMKITTVAQV